jgi:diguanylate cyclase (GGDEF)-like protein/PAS domain S-box-containing protein
MGRKKSPKIEKLINMILEDDSLKHLLSRLGIFIVDYHGRRSLINEIWKDLGHHGEHMYEGTWTQFLHPEDRKRVEANLQDLVKGKTDFFREVYRVKDPTGGWRWISNRGGVIHRDENGAPWFFIGTDEDMTRIKEAQEEASHRAREAGTLNATIEVITSSLDLDETVKRVLEQARRVVPYDRATVQILHEGHLQIIGGQGFTDPKLFDNLRFPYPEEGSLSTRAIQERRPWMSNDVRQDFPKFIQVEDSVPARSWIGVPLIAHGDVIGLISFDANQKAFYTHRHLELARAFAGPVAIAMENARLHGETYKLAMVDALTGIGSRHSFDLNSRFLFEKSRREERELSLAMLDLDRFKEVNDDFGHQVGDVVLQDVCRACESGLRATDMIARYGGEEIIILFPDTNVKTAADIAERIRASVAELKISGVDRSVTVSAGITGSQPDRHASLAEMIREADAALYKAKAQGRNRIVVY